MDLIEALVDLDGCAATLDRFADLIITHHEDLKLAEAVILLGRTIRRSRDVLRPVMLQAHDRERAVAAPVVRLVPMAMPEGAEHA